MKMEQIGKGTTWVFRADNLDETFQILSDRGVKSLSPPKPLPWGGQAMFEDLYGNQYALMVSERQTRPTEEGPVRTLFSHCGCITSRSANCPGLEITVQCAHSAEFGIAFWAQKGKGNSKR